LNLLKRRQVVRKILFTVYVIFLLLVNGDTIYANDTITVNDEDIDYQTIQEVIDDVLQADEKINFEKYVMDLISGKNDFSFKTLTGDIKEGIKNEVQSNIGTLTGLISIAVIAAVFTNFSHAFQNSQIAETGFYIAYLLLFSILTVSFISAARLADNTLSAILEFMKVLIPSYFITVAFTSGAATSMVYYQATLFLITFVDALLIHLIIPMINIFLIVSMANNLSKDDMLSKLAELISTVIKWMLKTLLAVVIGVNAIQGLILPVAENIKRSVFIKAAGSIPGVGNVLGGVAESIIGAGVLLKNAVGVAGVIVILIICAVPIIKLVVTALIYRISCAAVQPISDKRMLNCVSASAEAAGLLLQTVFVGAVLFLLTITIVAATTT
jgi:stage III sporulation protein AE